QQAHCRAYDVVLGSSRSCRISVNEICSEDKKWSPPGVGAWPEDKSKNCPTAEKWSPTGGGPSPICLVRCAPIFWETNSGVGGPSFCLFKSQFSALRFSISANACQEFL